MAPQTSKAPTGDKANAGPLNVNEINPGPLSADEVVDALEPPKVWPKDNSGKKFVQATPAVKGATTVLQTSQDFKTYGNIDHPSVEFDFRENRFRVEIGIGISKEAADFLVKRYPSSFKIVDGE